MIEQSDTLLLDLALSLPEDQLLPGEVDLIQAHLAGLIARAFKPEDDSDIIQE